MNKDTLEMQSCTELERETAEMLDETMKLYDMPEYENSDCSLESHLKLVQEEPLELIKALCQIIQDLLELV